MILSDENMTSMLLARGADVAEVIGVLVLAAISILVNWIKERNKPKGKPEETSAPDAAAPPPVPVTPLETLRLDRAQKAAGAGVEEVVFTSSMPRPSETKRDSGRSRTASEPTAPDQDVLAGPRKIAEMLTRRVGLERGPDAAQVVRPPPARPARGQRSTQQPPKQPKRQSLSDAARAATPEPPHDARSYVGALDPAALRRAIVINEVLSPPLSMRDEA